MPLEQSAAAAVAKRQSRSCTASFTTPTKQGSVVIVVAVGAGTMPARLQGPAGFVLLGGERGLRDLQMSVWIRENAPPLTSVTVTSLESDKSLQVRAIELSGMAQSSVVDKLVGLTGESGTMSTGSTGVVAQDQEIVLAFAANQYASTSQYGFAGGVARLYETTSPRTWARGTNEDWEQSRLSVHIAQPNSKASWSFLNLLSTSRRWLTLLVTLRTAGGYGPARMTSTKQAPVLDVSGGRASLSIFGPLTSRGADPVLDVSAGSARIGPCDYQYQLGGWGGLLVGYNTPWRVEGLQGLEGWDVRTSDSDLPRGDGDSRGVDLQSARQVVFKIGCDWGPGQNTELLEDRLDQLYRALVPQRDTDWDLIWRHPGRPLRMLRCRPVTVNREQDLYATIRAKQPFVLRAADPRHYSAFLHTVAIPQTPLGATPRTVAAINLGSGAAWPLIRVAGPTDGRLLRRVELVNQTQGVTWDVMAAVAGGSTLLGDMEAWATGAPRSVVTIDDQPKYNAWQLPRRGFYLGPGANDVYLRTDPPDVPILCTLEYRDTWSG